MKKDSKSLIYNCRVACNYGEGEMKCVPASRAEVNYDRHRGGGGGGVHKVCRRSFNNFDPTCTNWLLIYAIKFTQPPLFPYSSMIPRPPSDAYIYLMNAPATA